MSDEKERIHRALMGDKQAQEECTEKGILLPCPFCGASGDDVNLDYNSDISQFWIHCWKCHADGPLANYNASDAFALWNTRPAQPIGRCGECKHCVGVGKNQALRCTLNSFGVEFGLGFITSESFCSYFEPREGE